MFDGLLILLFVGMLAYHGAAFVRHRRPLRLAFLAFWGLLLFAHVEGRDDLYPVGAPLLLAAIVMARLEPAVRSRAIRREFERAARAARGRR